MDFFKDIFKDVSYSFNERIRNPYWFSLLLLFIYFNWESLFHLIENLFASADQGVEKIKTLEFSIWAPFLLAFVGVIVFYLVQYFGLIITVVFQDRIKPNILERFSDKRIASAEKVIGLRNLITQLTSEKGELENQIGSLRNAYESQVADIKKEIMPKDNTIKTLEERNSKLKEQNSKLKEENKQAKNDLNDMFSKEISIKEEKLDLLKSEVNELKAELLRKNQDLEVLRSLPIDKSGKSFQSLKGNLKTFNQKFYQKFAKIRRKEIEATEFEELFQLSDSGFDKYWSRDYVDFIKEYTDYLKVFFEEKIGRIEEEYREALIKFYNDNEKLFLEVALIKAKSHLLSKTSDVADNG